MAKQEENFKATLKRIFNGKSIPAGICVGFLASFIKVFFRGPQYVRTISGAVGASFAAGAIAGACADPTWKGALFGSVTAIISCLGFSFIFRLLVNIFKNII